MQAQSNKSKLFIDMYLKHNDALSNYCRILCKGNDEAKDLMSETIEIAFCNFNKLRDQEKFKSYLFGIASNLIKKKLRRRRSFDTFYEKNKNSTSVNVETDTKVSFQILKATSKNPLLLIFAISNFLF